MPNKPNKTGEPPKGTHWKVEEEEYFWQVVIPNSPKSVDDNPKEKWSWEECGEEMFKVFGKKYRKYTNGCLSEHWYHNISGPQVSPKAWPYVEKYRPKWEAKEAKEAKEKQAAAAAEAGVGTAADGTDATEQTLKEKNAHRRLRKRRRRSDAETESPIDPALQPAGRRNKRIKIVRRPAAPVAEMHSRANG